MKSFDPETLKHSWTPEEPDRLMGRGHPAGDFLEAHEWRIESERTGFLRLRVHLPDAAKNPLGELFGGFTPAYVDLVALHTVNAGARQGPRAWLTTAGMRLDYIAPVTTDHFVIESELLSSRGRTHHVQTRFLDAEGKALVLATTTLIEVRRRGSGSGDGVD